MLDPLYVCILYFIKHLTVKIDLGHDILESYFQADVLNLVANVPHFIHDQVARHLVGLSGLVLRTHYIDVARGHISGLWSTHISRNIPSKDNTLARFGLKQFTFLDTLFQGGNSFAHLDTLGRRLCDNGSVFALLSKRMATLVCVLLHPIEGVKRHVLLLVVEMDQVQAAEHGLQK
jgi:hypothetical protein